MQSRSLPTNVTLEYDLTGHEGADVLCFVHGVGSNLRQFELQRSSFESSHRVLRLSLRGHGGSRGPERPLPSDYTRDTFARDVVALWDALGIGSAHVVGNSLGGLIGYELLALAPERMRSLTTFGTTAALNAPAALTWTMTTLQRLLGSRGMSWLLERTASRDRSAARLIAQMYRSADGTALRHVIRDIATYDYTALLRTQTLPLLLIRGERDAEINAQLASTLAALRETPRFTLADLPEAGHYANLEVPAAFDRLLADFLATVDTARTPPQAPRRAPRRELQPA